MRKYLVGLALLTVVLSGMTSLKTHYQWVQGLFIHQFDQMTGKLLSFFQNFTASTCFGYTYAHHLSQLEQQNRELFARIANRELGVSSSSGSIRDVSHGDVLLSRNQSGWIILSGSDVGIQSGEILTLDGVFFGTINHVFEGYATVEALEEQHTPLLVIHAKSRTIGLFSVRGGQPRVTFTKTVKDLALGDAILSVPDGVHTKESFPLGFVSAVETKPSESVSSVQVGLTAQPKVYDVVRRVQVQI